MSEERAKILQMVADGKINADEASRLLAALGDSTPEDDAAASESVEQDMAANLPHFGSLWVIPMYAGLVLFVCGALAIFPLAESGSWLLAACGWPIFLLGLLAMIVAWSSRGSRWVHIRVTNIDSPVRNVKLSFPLPLRLTAWALKLGSRFAPGLKRTGVDEVILALNEGIQGDQPLYVDVQQGEGGERVQVYIG